MLHLPSKGTYQSQLSPEAQDHGASIAERNVTDRMCGVAAGQGGEKGGCAGFSATSAVKAVLAEDNGISSSVLEISSLVKSHSHESIEPNYGEMTEPENENKSALKDTPTDELNRRLSRRKAI